MVMLKKSMKKVKLHIQISRTSAGENLFIVREGATLLIKDGWRMKNRTWSNWILIPPVDKEFINSTVDVVIPETYEIEELAFKLHKKKQPWRGRAFGWNAEYSQSQERTLTGRPSRKVNFPAYFFIGELGVWMASFRWEDGDCNSPRFITDTSCVVSDQQIEHRYNSFEKNFV